MTRTAKIAGFAVAVALALTGCGAPAADVAGAAAEMVALQEVGYTADAGGDSPGTRPRAVRKLLRKNTLHGEVVVRNREGQDSTIVVQRGDVTAADDKGFTVRSADGFELTWTYGEKARVVDNREKAGRDAVRTGVKIGVGGVRDGSATTARLIIVG
ncbi:hypothetical protein Ait01nite_060890 [Actinoplanes italicus]|uniref:DUF5666 domain-containing protein n=1 Tax=Actinoplanes italicus TaxID=113567 RepID=A0A2T0K6T1_9ACTN|nr:hypothetical protein [Actinoplanes italicus]PRX18703.1 hypothetical protein CLV67_112178 [Actinoplanes italicus]GIE33044.1 hypothetical protein Ait01nite_060890 [Actinoplanes italicus]